MRVLSCFFSLCFALTLCNSLFADDPRPNIILILADDLGYGDVGFNGCTEIPTPNIDSLATDGVRFANGYSSHPFCSPMRAGLMTGRYQHRFGYLTNIAYDRNNHLMGLPTSEITIATRLRKSGYRTGMVGKWHLGAGAPFHPMRRGFDFFYGFLGGAHDYFVVDTKNPKLQARQEGIDDNGTPTGLDGYLTTVLTDQAIKFIGSNHDAPYFLYVAYNAPHLPLQAPKEEIAKFASIKNPHRRTYAAMVSVMDQEIGRLLKTIDQRGERENTLVIFLSDNGGPEANRSENGVLRGRKGDLFEGGVHVPMVMRMPGTLSAGTVYNEPVISIDLARTALELGGVELTDSEAMDDGVNLFPFMLGEKKSAPHDALYWRTTRDRKQAVRQGDFKFVRQNGKSFLFDLSTDLGESNNLLETDANNVQKVSGLLDRFEKWNELNKPSFFQGYTAYHKRLQEFHQQLEDEAKAKDVSESTK